MGLWQRKKSANSKTTAIEIVSKQGKSEGTFAHPMIIGKFVSWLSRKTLKWSLDKLDKDELRGYAIVFPQQEI